MNIESLICYMFNSNLKNNSIIPLHSESKQDTPANARITEPTLSKVERERHK